MRNQLMGGGVLAAGLLLVLGLVFVSGQGGTPTAEAQTCEGDANCVIISKEADDDGEFSFTTSEGDETIGGGESFAIDVDEGGSATVTEDETEGWTLASIECDEPDGVDVSADEEAGSVAIDFSGLADGEFETVECTFTNEMEEEEATATTTATVATTAEATATATEEASDSAASTTTATATSSNPSSAGTPVIPAVTPRPSSTQQVEAAGVISPPTTGSGGLK